jgi:anti-sigma B factor antagonist
LLAHLITTVDQSSPTGPEPLVDTDDRPAPFGCSVEPDRERVRIRPEGEIDLETARIVEARLEEVRETGFDLIELDLADTTFMDSTGLKLVLDWSGRSGRDGFQFTVTRCRPTVRRLFELTGTTHLLDGSNGHPAP